MEIFMNIRLKIGSAMLKSKAAGIRRKTSYSGFSHVRKIGIVWDASIVDNFHIISKFHQEMHERNIEVEVIGYYPGKELPNQYTAIRYLSVIRRPELSFFYFPSSAEAQKFIANNYDVLIDINFNNASPLRYITVLSKASFKVGLAEPESDKSPYDLMMDIKNPVDLNDYLQQVVKYLEMINSSVKVNTSQ